MTGEGYLKELESSMTNITQRGDVNQVGGNLVQFMIKHNDIFEVMMIHHDVMS